MRVLIAALSSLLSLSYLAEANLTAQPNTRGPLVTVVNGTFEGESSPYYGQDIFRGIPYAQPPIGDRRLRPPFSLNSTWSDVRSAKTFSSMCVGYGSDQTNHPTSEDCLTLNVIRPHNASGLPVAVWVHGGSFVEGGNSDAQYNMSFMVQNSVKSGNPIIGVNINYRLSGWGFSYGKEIQAAGIANLGLRDQRLAFHWIQENIENFGGDPGKVTIFGESSGAASVGAHLIAYGGRDDNLFRAVMAESGSPQQYARYNSIANTQASYDLVTSLTGCNTTSDSIQCLRDLPFETLNEVFNTTSNDIFYMPAVDGDFIQDYGSNQLKDGRFVKVPLLIGTNTDEATTYMFDLPLNTNADFTNFINDVAHVANDTILPILYPDIPAIGLPFSYLVGNERPTGALLISLGSQYKRGVAFYSDFDMHNNRRAASQAWSTYNTTTYSYRFNIIPSGNADYIAVGHTSEIAFVFNNLNGYGISINPFSNGLESYVLASTLMSSMWASFVTHLDPNFHGINNTAYWPTYSNELPQNFVFDANVTSYIEIDDFRAEAIQYMIDVAGDQYGR
ncbi:hypothetical protein BP6252_04029 [Coleophoma cylindrospora]|uniref:Carboxylic ester hydrolase n=1 Tax=Coleophoma cylindrospora TaxID=1849047 RepID=A0A3D8RZZ1_9HELO|nr:hypothetical protein BP6252_04029 [Coleophoma cylindrospora]